MYLIVGLGNPEEEYSYTRHNIGFDTINFFSKKFNVNVNIKGFDGIYGTGIINNEKAILLKPQTYMNLSGKSIKKIIDFYKIDKNKLIIIYDDIDIDVGKIKIRKKGGPGSHNGMKSVVSELNTEDFCRVRVGIGTPIYKNDIINYVISKVSKEEYNELSKGIEKAVLAVEEIINIGIDSAMNKFN